MATGTVTAEQMIKVLTVVNERFQTDMMAIVDQFSLKHCGSTFAEGGTALAYIFQTNKVSNKLLPNLNKAKKHLFYSNVSTNTFHKTFDISLVDIPLLHDILTKIKCFPTYVDKKLANACPPLIKLPGNNCCCDKCEHICKFCKNTTCDAACPYPSWDYKCKHCGTTISYCLELVCKSCDGKPLPEQCGYHRFMTALKFLKAHRDFCSHYTKEVFQKFLDENYNWKEYPTIKNWLNLSEKIVEYYGYLINFMCNGNAFKQPSTFSKRTEKVKSMTKMIDYVWLDPDLFADKCSDTYRKKELYKKSLLHLETICSHEYSFTLSDCVHDILKIEVVTDRNTLELISDGKYCFSSLGSLTIIHFKDVNFFEENRNFKLRIEFEILEDCNDIIWVATSDHIHTDAYKSSMIRYQDKTEKAIQISPDGNLVLKKRIDAEKIPLGILVMLEKEAIGDVLLVQQKKSTYENWRTIEVEETRKEIDDYFIFTMKRLERKQNYDVRVLASKQSSGELKEYILFELFDEIVLAEYDLKHASSYSTEKFVVFSHSYGKKYSPQDIVSTEMYQNFQKLQPFKLFVKQGGGKYRHLTLSKLEDYLTIYFKKRSPIIFPPIYDDSAPHSTIKSIINLLEESFLHMKKDFCVIIPDFNYYEAMEVMEMDYAQFGLKPGAFASNGIIVFDLDLHLVLSARICSGNSINDIKDSMELMHADTKSLILLCKDFIGKNHLTVYGTIAFPEMSRVKLEDALFCEFCKSDIHFITEDDLQDKNHLAEWWVKMCDSLKDDDMMEDDFSSNREWFSKIPSQLMVVIARERDDLPVLYGNDDKRIRSLLLNPDQVKAIHYPAKKKIIRGPFGSGKTIIGRHLLKDAAKSCDVNESVVYFIGMDEYSLQQVEMEEFCKEIKNSLPSNLMLHCVNILEISLQSDSNHILSFPECLDFLSQKHSSKTVHVIADEYDSEKLNAKQATEVKMILETNEAFLDATVAVIVQSIEKDRSTALKDQKVNHESHCFKETGMKVITLSETMRYSVKIHDIASTAQTKIGSLENTLVLPNAEKKSQNLPDSSIGVQQLNLAKPLEVVKSVERPNDGKATTFTEVNVFQPKVDTIAQYITEDENISDDFTKLITSFRFFTDAICKHGIEGNSPKSLRIDLQFGKNIPAICYFLQSICFSGPNKSGLVICNSRKHLELVKEAFKLIPLEFIEYANCIQLESAPPIERKRDVYYNWMKSNNVILLADSSGCRGLECEKVLLIVDENEYFERHLFVESLCRSTSQLFLLSFMCHGLKASSKKTNLSEVFDLITNKKFVKDVSTECTEHCQRDVACGGSENTTVDSRDFEVPSQYRSTFQSMLTPYYFSGSNQSTNDSSEKGEAQSKALSYEEMIKEFVKVGEELVKLSEEKREKLSEEELAKSFKELAKELAKLSEEELAKLSEESFKELAKSFKELAKLSEERFKELAKLSEEELAKLSEEELAKL